MGRKKLYPVRVTLPLTDEMAEGIDASLTEGEDRVEMIRDSIDRELKRRERSKSATES